MKLNKLFALAILSLVVTASCKKEYLDDIQSENGSLGSNIIFTTEGGAVSALTGTYWILRSENFTGYGSTLGSASTLTNRGLQNLQFHFDARGRDMVVNTSYYGAEYNWDDALFNPNPVNRSRGIWEMFYKVINNANAIILNVPNVATGDQVKAQLIAEAKALRAYSYFWLARSYQYTYSKDPAAKGIPIYLSPATGTTEGNPRASLTEVYNLILSDLKEAVAVLSTGRAAKYRINKNVAAGMLAEVYQEMAGNSDDATLWQGAVEHAKIAYSGYPIMSNATYNSGFNNIDNAEWIWGFPVPATEQMSYYSLFSYIDPDNGYYKSIYVNDDFYKSFSETDARKSTFREVATTASTRWAGIRTTKYKAVGAIYGDILIMRGAEMVLIEAEGLARQGNLQAAVDLVYNQIQKLRDPAAVKPAASVKADVINMILLERRKELYAEIGTDFFDLKRNQLPLRRTGLHRSTVLDVPATDTRWLFRIPQSEIDANPNINPGDQNP